MYNYKLIVRKVGPQEWTIFTENNIELHTLTSCHSAYEALERAKAWSSSWNSVNVEVDDGKSEKRD